MTESRVTRRTMEKIEDALFLMSQGVDKMHAAHRVGWAPRTLDRMIDRAEQDGIKIPYPEWEKVG